MNDQSQAGGNLEPGLMFYQILKPGPVLQANGTPNYAIIGQSQDLGSAIMFSNQHPGSILVLTVVLHKNTATLTPGQKPITN